MFRQEIRNITEICHTLGVKKAVIAPGSRNAPLTLAFTTDKRMDCLSITDERSAAYFALGIAQYQTEPVVLICTSGTAVLNFAPAIAEAYYQNLPLIVITADRPAAWIDQSDGQTIRQKNIYSGYIKASFEIPEGKGEDTWHSDRTVSQAVATALEFPMGPVHINVPLSEPLYVEIPEIANPKIIQNTKIISAVSADEMNALQSEWNKCHRKLIVVGIHNKESELNVVLAQLAERKDVIVLAENLSNFTGEGLVCNPEVFVASLSDVDKKNFQPDLLITLGNSVVSKQLKKFLISNPPQAQWQIGAGLPYADTYQCLNRVIQASPIEILKNLSAEKENGTYTGELENAKRLAHQKLEAYFSSLEYCDVKIVSEILKNLPADFILQISNSTPIRYSQLFETRSDLEYFCNRGTSGIEGSVSTAVGSSYRSQKPTLLITGDLSFLYDSNGFWNKYIRPDFKVIVFNNDGANIFRMIGNNDLTEECQDFFDAPYQVDISLLTRSYGLKHLHCENLNDFHQQFDELCRSTSATVLEVKTDKQTNINSYKALFKYIKN